MNRLLAMAWKEWIEIIRDGRTLYLAIFLPLLMVLIFGYAINFDVDHIPVGVVDQDNSRASREFQARLFAPGWLEKKAESDSLSELSKKMKTGEIKMILSIPKGFKTSLSRNESTPVFLGVDGSDNTRATLGNGYFQNFLNLYELEKMRKRAEARGEFQMAGVQTEPRVYFNPELKSRYFILPGIMVVTLAILAALLTSISIAREWERGSMEQLIATPIRPVEMLLGKLVPYLFISLIQVAITVVLGLFLFHVPLRGSLFDLFAVSLLFSTAALGLGLFFSAVLKAQMVAMQISLIATMLPSVFLSGFIFPIESMPGAIQLITYILPAQYYLVMLRTIFLKGSGFEAFWLEALFLFIFSLIVLNVARIKLVKRIG